MWHADTISYAAYSIWNEIREYGPHVFLRLTKFSPVTGHDIFCETNDFLSYIISSCPITHCIFFALNVSLPSSDTLLKEKKEGRRKFI